MKYIFTIIIAAFTLSCFSQGTVPGYTAVSTKQQFKDFALYNKYIKAWEGLVAGDTGAINGNALIEIRSTTKGFLPSRLTAVQRNAISLPANGLMVYDTDTNDLMRYDSFDGWRRVGAAGGGSYTFNNGLTETGGTAKLGGALTASTSVTYNPDSRVFSLGTIDPITFAGKGAFVGTSSFGELFFASNDRNYFYGPFTSIAGDALNGGANFGRMLVEKGQTDLTNRLRDSIEIGLANIANEADSSVYSNIFNAIYHGTNDSLYGDIQRFVNRYYFQAGKVNRSFMEMTQFTGLSTGTSAQNSVFINNNKVQINFHQNSQQHAGGDTATALVSWQFNQTGLKQFGANGVVKASIDTTGFTTTQGLRIVGSQLDLSGLGLYADDAAAAAGGVPVGYAYIDIATGTLRRRLI